jgi:hypothetical protein
MQVRSNFNHLITENIMIKTKFKMDTIWVRLIILNFMYHE